MAILCHKQLLIQELNLTAQKNETGFSQRDPGKYRRGTPV